MNPASVTDSPNQRAYLPAEAGIWLVILGDGLMFSILFGIFLAHRGENAEAFSIAHHQMNQAFGLFNTFLMLTSSWFVAMSVRAARSQLGRATPVLLSMAAACGFIFGIVKIFEYREKIAAGITLQTNDFYMFYFIFTGIHLVHVVIGTVILLLLVAHTWNGGYESPARIRNVESGACFWHLVDLLWIVILALFYLIP